MLYIIYDVGCYCECISLIDVLLSSIISRPFVSLSFLVCFVVTANALIPRQRGLSPHMGCYSRYHADRLIDFGLGILSWRRSRDGGVQKTNHVRRVVRVVRVPVDCFGTRRNGCAFSSMSQARGSLLSLLMRDNPFPMTFHCAAEIQRMLLHA